ncbi:hypothetical protein QBC39DRAFT_352195 [Podospora conica]|nr:hypothetical protein QBC39DRAFT_352195 [Schizothecium conicum]
MAGQYQMYLALARVVAVTSCSPCCAQRLSRCYHELMCGTNSMCIVSDWASICSRDLRLLSCSLGTLSVPLLCASL